MNSLIIDTLQYPLTFAPGDVQDLNQQFTRVLEDLRVEVKNRGIDLNNYTHDYLARIRNIGKTAHNKVLPPAARHRIVELEHQERGRGLSLTFKTPPTYSLFWQMLYAGGLGEAEIDKFWGFRYPLGRTYWEIRTPDRIRLQDGIFSVIHDGLKLSRQEVIQINKYLESTGGMLGVQLSLQILEDVIPLDRLSIETLVELFHSKDFGYGIVHFACHAENMEDMGATRAYLIFTGHEAKLKMCLGDLLRWQEYGFTRRPFVFLNTCSSATPGHLLQTMSFPTGILNFGAGGVIATACTIPDNFASAFASELYRRLFGQHGNLDNSEETLEQRVPLSSNIGAVLLETSLYFIEKYNNPLGLAYGLYAVSNQQLRMLD
jgi:hypothetical protein